MHAFYALGYNILLYGTEKMSTFGERLKVLRKKKRWSQKELSCQSGVSREVIAKIENDTTKQPTPENIEALSCALGCKPADLHYGEEKTEELSDDVIDAAKSLQGFPPEKRKVIIDVIKLFSNQQ